MLGDCRLWLGRFPQHVAEVLGIEGMALGQPEDQADRVVINAFADIQKPLADEPDPVFLRDGAERIVARCAVQGARLVQKHLLHQVLPAAKK